MLCRQIRSRITEEGQLQLLLVETELPDPGPDEVLVKVGAAPINPSDLGLLLGPADTATLRAGEGEVCAVADVPKAAMGAVRARVGKSLSVGNEGAGEVVAAGDSPQAQTLLGKTVAMFGGGMFADYRLLHAASCFALPDGVSAAQGAAAFVNPLTALGMVETMRMDGHTAIVHTPAASNLGQMLHRVCQADGVPLVNIVRRPAQVELLRGLGAAHVLDSSADDYREALTDALRTTDATIAFDAIGGGDGGSRILAAMERVQAEKQSGYSVYGSTRLKQLCIYGRLDLSPTILHKNTFGFAWSVSGFLLTALLQRIGAERAQALQARVAAEITTTFASHYGATVSLQEALQPEAVAAYAQQATGQKTLLTPR